MLRNYLKITLRNFTRNKSYCFTNVIGLATSTTCGILIFTLVKHHLSYDNFHPHSDRIYRIVTEMHRDNISYSKGVPAPLGKAFRNEHTFGERVARIATFTDQLVTLTDAKEARKIKEAEGLAFTETDFFEIFNYPLVQGNRKTSLTEPNTAIMTERMAKKYYGTTNAIGKQFLLNSKILFTVTGILKNLPNNTDRKTEIYVSYSTLKLYNEWLASDDAWGGIQDAMQCFVLLRPQFSVAQVEKVFPAYVKKYRPTSKNVHRYKLQPLADVHFNSQYEGAMDRQNLWILSIIGLFLIITACVNFINLATAQALNRSKEVGMRKVLGGQKRQIFWQFISETAVLVSAGIGVALTFSYLLLPVVNDFFKTQMSINLFQDWKLALFITTLGIIVTLLSGSYPGIILSGFQPVVALKGKPSQQTIGGFNVRRALIVVQFSISQVLVIGVVVVLHQVRYTKQANLGFDKEAILMIPVGADSTKVKMNALKNEIAKISGVENISLCFAAPASDNAWNNSIKFDNQPEEVNFRTSIKSADEAYISTFGLELVAGRNILPSDTVKEFLVNEAFTRKLNFQKPEQAIGKNISANGGSMVAPIVGIVKDFHDRSFHEDISAVALTTLRDNYQQYAVKLNLANAKKVINAVEKVWTKKYPDQLFEYQFLDESIARFYETESRFLSLIQAFACIAIFIGCLGLYGLMSFMVTQKTKEIGIRKVLGGSITHIVFIFVREFARLVVSAFLIAAPVGWWLMSGWLQNFKYRVDINVWVFAATIALSLTIAFLTTSYQAIRAAMANPVKSLRTE